MIEIENVSKIYNNNKSNSFQALKNVSIKINNNEMVAIMGKSGAGKSTLMHIIGCIDDFESGEYKIDGISVKNLSDVKKAELRNSKVGIVMQDFALIEEYSVLENVTIPLYFKKKSGKKIEKAMAAIKKIGIDELAKKSVNKLSGGQKQRVAIARAIVNNPSIILADEPTGALDSGTSKEIMEVLRELNNSGKTIIIITHDESVAKKCDRVIWIEDGKILEK